MLPHLEKKKQKKPETNKSSSVTQKGVAELTSFLFLL